MDACAEIHRSVHRLSCYTYMKTFVLGLAIVLITGCVTKPVEHETKEFVTQEEVISLLEKKKVKGVFQPHYGYVSVDLKNGERKWFKQEKMDWIIQYVMENHKGELEYVAME